MPSLIENHLELFELFYAQAESQRDIQAGRRCGSLAADNRQLELNTKLIGWPVSEISSFEITEILNFMTSLLTS